jgi:tRNA threonylcarbamoyladenosine biosynthesis protein TsaB
MNIVAIETATETIGVAARAESGAHATFSLSGRRRHVETLVPALGDLLAQLELAPTDLNLVAVDLGPGLFTGLRVGVAAAKGLAQALGIGVMGLSSLDILTRGGRRPAR